jgi:hypothetical protein
MNNNFLELSQEADTLISSIAKDDKWIKEIDFSKVDSDQIILFLLHLRTFITKAFDFKNFTCEEIDLLLDEVEKLLQLIEQFLVHKSEILTDEEQETLLRKKGKLSLIREGMIEKIFSECNIPPHKIAAWKSNFTIWKEAQKHKIPLSHIAEKLQVTGSSLGKGSPPLLLAVLEGDYTLAKELINTNKEAISTLPNYGLSALSFAILLHHHDIAKLLIEHGANIHGDNTGNPFLLAYKKKDHTLIQLFIEKGADPTTPVDLQNVLQVAFCEAELNPSKETIENIKTLLQCPLAHLNEQPDEVKPYLFSAIELKDPSIIKMLIEKQIDPHRKWRGKTALEYAQEKLKSSEEESKILEYLQQAK